MGDIGGTLVGSFVSGIGLGLGLSAVNAFISRVRRFRSASRQSAPGMESGQGSADYYNQQTNYQNHSRGSNQHRDYFQPAESRHSRHPPTYY